ncbi:MAG: hypothetical protein M3Q99_19800, partial [Acidobacteriota bacterium]|nr:hypothetical protein [Acidobacteriota bacterium]
MKQLFIYSIFFEKFKYFKGFMSLITQNQSELNTLPLGSSFYNSGHFKTGIEREANGNSDDFKILSNWTPQNQDKEITSNQFKETLTKRNQIEENSQLNTEYSYLGYSFEIGLSDFNYDFNLDVVDLDWNPSSSSIALYLSLDEKLIVKAILEGYWEHNEESTFKLESFGLKLEKKQEIPISIFLSSTLWSMLGLSSNFRIHIPKINYDFNTSFTLSFKEIGRLLQERQIAYRLMVIEQALRISLPFPNGYISG